MKMRRDEKAVGGVGCGGQVGSAALPPAGAGNRK